MAMTSTELQRFMEKCSVLSLTQVGYAVALLWFHHLSEPSRTFSATELMTELDDLGRLEEKIPIRSFYAQLKAHPALKQKAGRFSIKPKYVALLDAHYLPLTRDAQASSTDRAELAKAPFLSQTDKDAALRMAILHCYENSARGLIRSVLSSTLGADWWQSAASAELKRKVQDRKGKEHRQRWISPRGSSPLVYIDWGDLLALIRKYQDKFQELIPEYKFVERRFEELERFRNIVAHSGVLPSDDEFQHVVLSFREWCRQVGSEPEDEQIEVC